MRKVRVGFIGTGGMAQVHALQLLELEDAKIEAIADINEEARERFVNKTGFHWLNQFSDYHDMLDKVDLDAVVICSPHTLHFQQATDALNKGLHVLIEKPMTCSAIEAEKLIETASKSGKIMQVSYQRHFQPEFIYIHDIIAKGEVGQLTSITASLYQDWSRGTTGSWRQNPKMSGGGFLMDSGSHIIDVLLWTSSLTPVNVESQMSQQGTPVEIDTFTSIKFKEGAVAGLNLVGCSPTWNETYVFCGTEGGILVDNEKITLFRNGKERTIPELPEQTSNQDKSFIDAIFGRHEVKVPGEFAMKVVQLSESIYKAVDYKPY